ncbi:MAG: helix-turn-helix transcriptional regulator [Spirochaetales bacterium]|nr:helix-turn-helix transcriptional regulator [Spirochaetales bacterium]
MKEILKYLRQLNAFTQEEIARRLKISRQTYIKYESGEVEPGDRIIRGLSVIYGVSEGFIRKNEIPKPEYKNDSYFIEEKTSDLSFESPSVPYGASVLPDGRRILEGFFDGTTVRLLGSVEGLNLKKGQKFRLYVETEEEENRSNEVAFNAFMDIIKKGKKWTGASDEDPYYKESINRAREEKYESAD